MNPPEVAKMFDDDGRLTPAAAAQADEVIEKVKDAVRPYVQVCNLRDLVQYMDFCAIHAGAQLMNERLKGRATCPACNGVGGGETSMGGPEWECIVCKGKGWVDR